MNFDKFKETTVPYKLVVHCFDVRAQAKTDETQIEDIVQSYKEGVSVRPAYVSADLVEIDGRNGVEAAFRFLGGGNPDIPVRMFPWNYFGRSERDLDEIQNWALKQNAGPKNSPLRRFATKEDEYLTIRRLVDHNWTADDIRQEFSGVLSHPRLTDLIKRAETAHENVQIQAARAVKKANPTLTPEQAVRRAVPSAPAENLKNLVSAVGRPTKKKPGVLIRAHKFGAAMRGALKSIQSHGQTMLDAYREHKDGRSGLTEKGYIKHIQELQNHQCVLNSAIDEVVRRALTVMDVPAEALDKKRVRR